MVCELRWKVFNLLGIFGLFIFFDAFIISSDRSSYSDDVLLLVHLLFFFKFLNISAYPNS